MKKLRKLSVLAFLAVGFALVFGGCNSSVAEIAVTGVTIDPASAEITVGETKQLVANVSPSNATNKNVTWLSDNPSVATVDKDGKVTGVAVGITTITVVTDDRSFPARCVVGVIGNQENQGNNNGGNGSSGGQTGGNASGSDSGNNSGNNGSTGGNTGSSGGQSSGNAGSDRPGDSDSSGNTGNPGTSSGGQTGGNASGSDSGNNSGNNGSTGGNTGSSGGQSSGNTGSDMPGDSGSSGNEGNTGDSGSSGGQEETAKAGIIIGDTVYKFADLEITEKYGNSSWIKKNSDGTLTVTAGSWDQFNIPLPTAINIAGKKVAITAKVASGYEQGDNKFKLIFAENDDKQSEITANKAADGGNNEGWCDPLTTEFETYTGSDIWTAYQKDEAADLTNIAAIIIDPQSGEGDITIQSIEFVD